MKTISGSCRDDVCRMFCNPFFHASFGLLREKSVAHDAINIETNVGNPGNLLFASGLLCLIHIETAEDFIQPEVFSAGARLFTHILELIDLVADGINLGA